MPALLEARHLHYAYNGGPPVITDVSFAVEPGSMTALIGSNGSGKSTLIRMLAGLQPPRSGEVLLRGKPLRESDPRLRAREIAYVPQNTSTAFPFKAIDVVLTGRTPHTPRFRFENARDRRVALEALDIVGAASLAERALTSLSGGERQMIIVARALAQEPALLLLDEPSSSLDLKHRVALIRTLVRLRQSRSLSVIMITHDLHLVGSNFDHILALRSGRLAAQGTPESVLRASLLCEIYDDPNVRTTRIGDQILVWMEA